MSDPTQIMVAKTTAHVSWDGRRIVIKENMTTAHAGHPLVQAHASLWKPLQVAFPYEAAKPVKDPEPVNPEPAPPGPETATAGPGERREVSTPAPARKTRRGPRTPAQGAGE